MRESEIQKLHASLAMGYVINSIYLNGLKNVYKEIDQFSEYDKRLYLRYLTSVATKLLKKEGIKVYYQKPKKRK